MAATTMMARPQRWDEPFGPDMTDRDVETLMQRPEIAAIHSEKFPPSIPLQGILKNDTRVVHYKAGDIVVREGDYGNSAFLVLEGAVRVVVAPDLPEELLGRKVEHQKNFFQALSQLWTNRWVPEVRNTDRLAGRGLRKAADAQSSHVFLQDVPAILDSHKTAVLKEGDLFGELAALGRIPRTATVFAENETTLLEIRWQGLRELRKFDEGWRRKIDEKYRQNALNVHLSETPFFSGLSPAILQEVADNTLFETYGAFDWHVSYQKMRSQGQNASTQEPSIAREGDYPDGLLLIRAGFARVSIGFGHGRRTLSYLTKGGYYGLDELYEAWKNNKSVPLETSLTALGYVDVLRVPTRILEQHVFENIKAPKPQFRKLAARPITEDALLEWAVDERFINGTKTMLIDLDKCTRCDDCVRACASTHGGNPRFIRHGKVFDHWMVANACMHCADPVCMIGCPTGAIHRSVEGGTVVINDDTCIGCGTCANSCPYDNIRMVEIRDIKGNSVRDPETQNPVLKATKCDLCSGQLGGPACVRACPHGALQRTDFHAVMEQHKPRK